MPTITFKVTGQKEITRTLKNLGKGIRNPKKAFKEVGNYVVKDLKENVESGNRKRRFGGAWEALAPSTLKARKKRWGYYKRSGSGTKPLVWSGSLKKGFKIGKLKKFLVEIINPVQYKGVKYFAFTHKKRESMGLNKAMIKDIMEIFEKYITKILKK